MSLLVPTISSVPDENASTETLDVNDTLKVPDQHPSRVPSRRSQRRKLKNPTSSATSFQVDSCTPYQQNHIADYGIPSPTARLAGTDEHKIAQYHKLHRELYNWNLGTELKKEHVTWSCYRGGTAGTLRRRQPDKFPSHKPAPFMGVPPIQAFMDLTTFDERMHVSRRSKIKARLGPRGPPAPPLPFFEVSIPDHPYQFVLETVPDRAIVQTGRHNLQFKLDGIIPGLAETSKPQKDQIPSARKLNPRTADNYIIGTRGQYLELADSVVLIDPEGQLPLASEARQVRDFLNHLDSNEDLGVHLLQDLLSDERIREYRRLNSKSGNTLEGNAAVVNAFNLLVICLADRRVRVRRASIKYQENGLKGTWVNLDLDAATALFLIMCVGDQVHPECFQSHNKGIARAIRHHSLLPLIHLPRLEMFLAFEYQRVIRNPWGQYGPDLYGSSARRTRFENSSQSPSVFSQLNSIQACHDMLVAYLLHNPSEGAFGSLTVDKLVGLCKGSKLVRVVDRISADVEQLGLELGLVYAAIISSTTDILNDTVRKDADKAAAIAAIIGFVSSGVTAGSAFIPGPSGPASAVGKTVDSVLSVLFNRATARYTRRQESARALVNEIVHRFNILVLGEADQGSIPNLDLASPPSDPDLVPIMTPTPNGHPISCRPTAYDIKLFKETACNTVIVLCSVSGITVENGYLALIGMPQVSLGTEAIDHKAQYQESQRARFDPGPDLLQEIKKQFHEDDVPLWFDLISGVARAMTWPRCDFNEDLASTKPFIKVEPGWNYQIKRILQTPENAFLQGLVEKLRDRIAERDKRKEVYPEEIARKVRYFFIDPPRVTHMRSLGHRVNFD